MLIARGANMDARSREGNTPLDIDLTRFAMYSDEDAYSIGSDQADKAGDGDDPRIGSSQ